MIDPTTLEPELQAWIARNAEILASIPEPPDPLDFAARRAREREVSDRLAAEFARPVDGRVTIAEVTVPTPAGELYARLLRPTAAVGALATQVYLHGGGFISGTARELINDAVLSERAAEADLQILSLDYRLAPENPYPAAVEDTIAVLAALASEPARWGADPARLGVGGASAGGHIAAVTALRLRDAERAGSDGPALVHALLEIPALGMTEGWPSMTEFSSPELTAGALAVVTAYRGPLEPDAYFDPSRVADLADLPRTMVMTAELDPLRDAAEDYARRLVEAGVDARLRRGDGQLHGTCGLVATVPSARAWQDAAITELREGLALAP